MEAVLKGLPNYSRAKWIRILFVIFFSVGAAGLSYQYTRDLFIWLMPFSLLLSMGLMFLMHDNWKTNQIIIFFIIALMGFFLEVAGVLTGVVFGEYSYGSALGFKIMGTPPLIGLNWLMLIYAVYLMMNRLHLHVILKIFLGAALMVVYDIIMEPVAINLDMWSWGGGDIPIQNYIAWFVISAVMLSIFYFARVNYHNKVASWLFFIQMAFFLVLNFTVVH
jgi:bisanhydrobacterioruberin hydratase